MKKGQILLIVFLTACSIIKAQVQDNEVDSLLRIYEQNVNDTTRIQVLIKIGDIYEYEIPDTALTYYHKALEYIAQAEASYSNDKTGLIRILALKAKSYLYIGIVQKNQGNYEKAMVNCYKSLQAFDRLNDKKGMAGCHLTIGRIYSEKGLYHRALESFNKTLEIEEELGNKKGMARCYNNIGVVFYDQGNFDKSMEYYFKTLKISEELGDKTGMGNSYNNIGMIHDNQGNSNKAKEYYLKSFEIAKELGDKNGIAVSYNNLGNIFHFEGNYNKAMEYYLKCLQQEEELGNKSGMAVSYNNIGAIYSYQGNYDKAFEYYLKSLKIDQELDDKNGVAIDFGILAGLHITLADSSKSQNTDKWSTHLNSAINYALKSYMLAKEIDVVPIQNEAAAHLLKAYTKLDRYKDANKYAEIYIATKDSIFSREKIKAIAEMTTKYEAETKQLQIEKMEKQKELDDKTIEAQQAENRKQQITVFSAIGGFLIVLAFPIIILRLFRQKRTANILLAKQNNEIKHRNGQIEEQNQNITDSIVYAQRIQHALLPPGDYIKQLLPQRFVLFKPRNIVSGDFYWVNKKDGLIITAAADSTGSGVPGAMLSMLGVSILNEVINTMQKPDAGEILNSVRGKFIDSLHQGDEKTIMWDGFDIALCLIDLKKQKIYYAGANNSLYLIRDGELQVIEADNMPIGIHYRMEPFTNHNIKIQSGDILYIFSDGYMDQFGGENDKRFTRKRFRKLLIDIHDKPMKEQKEELNRTINEWLGKSEQIDDILVMGVRI